MKKYILFFILVATLPMYAAVRSEADALMCAQSFFAAPPANAAIRRSVGQSLVHLAAAFPRQDSDLPAFYAFNRGETDGYVLISADDALPTVLGYADSGTMDVSDMPDNMRAWIENYQRELTWLADHPNTYTVRTAFAAVDQVEPLLGNIQWNQSAPFNNQCPIYTGTSRASAGCVATATAQVMKYYQHPERGTGSQSYTSSTQKFELSANFDTTYQWSLMLDKYTAGKYTTAQGDAVALLLSHVGIACDMNYANSGSSSSAQIHNAGYALKTYFGYDKSLQFHNRDYYAGDWENLIRTELRASRPVIYAGFGPSGGHSFVCDGFNADGYFHFNWGWSGSNDGYFLLTVLYPTKDAAYTMGKYSYSQQALVGVKPDAGGVAPEIAHCTYKDLTVEKESYSSKYSTIKFTAHYLQNNSVDNIKTNSLAILFMQNSMIKARFTYAASSTFKPSTYYPTLDFSGTLSSLADGTYDVTLGYWESGYEKWRLVNGRGGTPYYYTLVVNGNSRTFTPRDKNSCVVDLVDVVCDSIAATAGTIAPVLWLDKKYHNYRDSMHLVLRNVATGTTTYTSPSYYVDLKAGQYDTTALSVSKTPAAGTYRAYVCYGDQVLDSLDRTLSFYTLKDLCTPHDEWVTCVDSSATLSWKSICDSFIVTISYNGGTFKNHYTGGKDTLHLYHLEPGDYTYIIMAYYKAAGSTKYTRYATSILSWTQPESPIHPTFLKNASETPAPQKILYRDQFYIIRDDQKWDRMGNKK